MPDRGYTSPLKLNAAKGHIPRNDLIGEINRYERSLSGCGRWRKQRAKDLQHNIYTARMKLKESNDGGMESSQRKSFL